MSASPAVDGPSSMSAGRWARAASSSAITSARAALAARISRARHPMVTAAAGLALLGGVAYAVWAVRQRNRPVSKARRFKHALSRMIDEPHKVAKCDPTVPEKILAAAGTAAATILVKKMMERAFDTAGRQRPANP